MILITKAGRHPIHWVGNPAEEVTASAKAMQMRTHRLISVTTEQRVEQLIESDQDLFKPEFHLLAPLQSIPHSPTPAHQQQFSDQRYQQTLTA